MNKTPARMGWDWVRQGFGMLRRQPAGLSTLFFGYMLLTTLLNIIPLLGPVAHAVLMPVFAIGFMSAARDIEAGKPVLPALLATGFRKPVFRKLCMLGVIHLLVILAVVFIVVAFADVDMLRNASPAELQANPALMRDANLFPGVLIGAAVYIPALLVISFAAPLVCWNGMGTAKSLFYSFFAVKRTAGAFFVFAISLFAIAFLVLQLLNAVLGIGPVGLALMRVVSVLLYGLAHCSLYVAYAHIFGPAPADPPSPPTA
jgi:magnesium-transporting ATPase (P-type)